MKDETKNSLRNILKKITSQDIIYPGVLVLVLAIIVVLFIFSTQFISKNINKIFYSDKNGGPTQPLDVGHYKMVAKKFGIAVLEPQALGAASALVLIPAPITTATTTPYIATNTTQKNTLDKKAITIIVKNSTANWRAAAALSKLFEKSGFPKPKAENEIKDYPTTTLIIKESKKDYLPVLLEIIHKSYPNVITTTIATSTTDVIIIIGTR